MNIKLSTEMRDYYNMQLEYAQQRAQHARADYQSWDIAAYMEDDPDSSITYAARAGLAYDEFLFWTSVLSSLKCKLKVI